MHTHDLRAAPSSSVRVEHGDLITACHRRELERRAGRASSASGTESAVMLEIATLRPVAMCIFVALARLALPSHARAITGNETSATMCNRWREPHPCASSHFVSVITPRYNAA